MTAPSRWRTWLALVTVALLGLWAVTDWTRFKADFWPPDASRVGPNLVASVVQAGLILVALSLIYPPTRHWVENYLHEHAEHLKAHVEMDNDRIKAELHDKLNVLHDCLDHIIEHHPDIPSLHGTSLGSTHGTSATIGEPEQAPGPGPAADPPADS